MLSIHPDARTTPAVRAEIARSSEPTGELARRYGASTETVREWRKRGPGGCLERFLFVAIDRRSRRVHLAVKDEETEAAAEAFWRRRSRPSPSASPAS